MRRLVAAVVVAVTLGLTLGLAQTPPVLTDLERTQVELLQARIAYAHLLAQYDGCKAEVGAVFDALGKLRASAASADLTAEQTRLTRAIEAAHPGFSWDAKTGAFIPKPAEGK